MKCEALGCNRVRTHTCPCCGLELCSYCGHNIEERMANLNKIAIIMADADYVNTAEKIEMGEDMPYEIFLRVEDALIERLDVFNEMEAGEVKETLTNWVTEKYRALCRLRG